MATHRIPTIAILCIFVEAIQQVRQLGRGREKAKKATENDIGGLAVKNWCLSHKFFYVVFNLSFFIAYEALILQWARKGANPKRA